MLNSPVKDLDFFQKLMNYGKINSYRSFCFRSLFLLLIKKEVVDFKCWGIGRSWALFTNESSSDKRKSDMRTCKEIEVILNSSILLYHLTVLNLRSTVVFYVDEICVMIITS